MSFNLDDPLAGILSDGSDDSFFDDDILGKKKPAKKKTTPIAEKKTLLFDLGDGDKQKPANLDERRDSLFDLGISDSKKVSAAEEDKIFKTDKVKSPGPVKKTVSRESIKVLTEPKTKPAAEKYDPIPSPAKSRVSASADKLNILDDLIEPKRDISKPLERGKSSQSLLDDILGGPPNKTSKLIQGAKPPTAATKSQEFDLDSILGKSEVKQSTVAPSKNISQKQNVKVETVKEDTTKKQKSSDDWLGIFQNKDDDDGEDDVGMPAWLIGDSKKKKPVDKEKIAVKEDTLKDKPKEITVEPEKTESISLTVKEKEPQLDLNFEHLTKTISPTSILRASNEDITAESAALYFQQQESQLMVAMQLKAQEEKLAAMHMRQKEAQRVQREATQAHHTQLDAILQRQAEQRQQMQAIISAHQERITQRIKDLLSSSTNNFNDEENSHQFNEENYITRGEKPEPPHMKEKKQLLQLVQSLQENHDKEIDLMESSYRRQLAFLEVSINQSEERMKDESDKLVKFYTEKINWLEEHHQLFKKVTEDNMSSLTERHKSENEMLRQQHLENIRILQEHHATLMENVKNAVKQEQVLIKDSAGFSSDLHELVMDVKESRSQCQQLVEKVQSLTDNTQRDIEKSLQARETQIDVMVQQLKKERENFDSEKTESRDLVKMLETRLKQMTTMIEEETALLKQKKMEFEFEKATFNKQAEFAKNGLRRQDEELKLLKDDIQREYKEKIAKIEDEKAKAIKDSAAVAKEKASIQSLKQELEKTKAELNAQLEEVTEERSKLNLDKQQLHMEEQRVMSKSRDLDLLARNAVEKQTQADKRYAEAEFIQRKYEDRIRRIQEHVVSLNVREKQIAKEKVALSRERLTLHNERKQLESRQQCSLCKANQNVSAYNFDAAYAFPETYLPVSRDYGGTTMNTAMTAIEQEMAHLMGRNFSLRHTAVVGSGHNERYDERTAGEDNAQPTQSIPIDSGAFKDYMDPKFMMLRLDVQQVLSNLDQNKKQEAEIVEEHQD